jgi:hypothetical protein
MYDDTRAHVCLTAELCPKVRQIVTEELQPERVSEWMCSGVSKMVGRSCPCREAVTVVGDKFHRRHPGLFTDAYFWTSADGDSGGRCVHWLLGAQRVKPAHHSTPPRASERGIPHLVQSQCSSCASDTTPPC